MSEFAELRQKAVSRAADCAIRAIRSKRSFRMFAIVFWFIAAFSTIVGIACFNVASIILFALAAFLSYVGFGSWNDADKFNSKWLELRQENLEQAKSCEQYL